MTAMLQRSIRAHLTRILYHSFELSGIVWHDAELLGRNAAGLALSSRGMLQWTPDKPPVSGRAAIRWAIKQNIIESKIDADTGRVLVRVMPDWPAKRKAERARIAADIEARHKIPTNTKEEETIT